MTVREFAQMESLGEVTATDVGQYKLHGLLEKFTVKNGRLLKMWPSVKDTPGDYDAVEEMDRVERKWENGGYVRNWMAWAAQTSLRCWVGMYQEAVFYLFMEDDEKPRPVWLGGDSDEAAQRHSNVMHFLETTRIRRPDVPFLPPPKTAYQDELGPIHKLGPEHSDRYLEWATEFLSLNIAGYKHWVGFDDDGEPERVFRSHWVEVDGGEHMGDTVSKAKKRSQAAWISSSMIKHPIDEHHMWQVATVQEWISEHELVNQIFGGDQLMGMSKTKLQQLAYLFMAGGWFQVGEEDGSDKTELDAFSEALLRKYILQTGNVSGEEVQDAKLDDLRSAFGLTMLALKAEAEKKVKIGQDQDQDEPDTVEKAAAAEQDLFLPFVVTGAKIMTNLWLMGKTLGDVIAKRDA